jgi:hypothetical protein
MQFANAVGQRRTRGGRTVKPEMPTIREGNTAELDDDIVIIQHLPRPVGRARLAPP